MRRSLSAVSSSTELEAVFTSTPSFFSRSMTSWLESFRSRASPKTLTFAIRPTLLGSTLRRRGGRLGRLADGGAFCLRRLLGRGFLRRSLFGGRLLRGRLVRGGLLGREPLGLGRVARVPVLLCERRRRANPLDRLRPQALERAQVLVRHLGEVREPVDAGLDQPLHHLLAHAVLFEAPDLV